MKNRNFWISLVIGIVILGGGGLAAWKSYQENQWQQFTNPEPQFMFDYYQKMNLTQSSEEEKQKAEPFVRLTEGSLETSLLVSIRMEKGLRLVTSLTHQDLIPYLLNSAEGAHPQRFSGYHKQSEREFELSGKKAAEITFTYDSPAGGRIEQRFMIIAYDGNTALYFAAQAKEADFDQLNKKYFDRIFQSLTFN